MKRVIVTGASGFIGRHVVMALRGHADEVHTVQHSARQMSDSRNHTANLLVPSEIDRLLERVKPTHLIHLAWYAEHGKYWTSPLNLDWVAASLRLLQAFGNNGGKRAVFAGTCAEYDWAHSPLNEESSPSHPGTLYGVCKNALRLIVEKYAAQNSLSVAWGRIFFLYGPHEHSSRLVPSILKPLLAGQVATVRSGGHVRNLMHVKDVAAAFVSILDSDVTGIINIADHASISLGDVARLVGELTGTPELLRIEQAAGTTENPLLLTADVNRLARIGFKTKISLRDGLWELIDPIFES